ncbi:hypothetical protein DUNSADRAFT_6558, partial [Dunaliella salina]
MGVATVTNVACDQLRHQLLSHLLAPQRSVVHPSASAVPAPQPSIVGRRHALECSKREHAHATPHDKGRQLC